MLVEKKLDDALRAYMNGKRVVVLHEEVDGEMRATGLDEVLKHPSNHFLVDAPAVEDPEFKQAVDEVVRKSETVPV